MARLDPELLTVPVVCGILGKSESAVKRLISEELLPTIRIGGSVRVEAQRLLEWIETGGRGYRRNKARF
jgi:excisionase family DNA binding protein